MLATLLQGHGWDAVAVALVSAAAVAILFPPAVRMVEDVWYHLSVARFAADAGTIPLWDTWSYQPAGRPQLYPPLLHVLLAGAIRLAGDPLAAALVVRGLLWTGTLVSAWAVGRSLGGQRAGALAAALVVADWLGFQTASSLMPAALVAALLPVLAWAVLRRRTVVAGLLIGCLLLTHPGLPWAVLLMLGIAATTSPELRRTALRAMAIGGAIGLVWWARVAIYLGAVDWERFARGVGAEAQAFGYASHWEFTLPILATWWWVALRAAAVRRTRALALTAVLGLALAGAVAAPRAGEAAPLALALAAVASVTVAVSLLTASVAALRRLHLERGTSAQLHTLLLATAIGFAPVALLYGGRATWHLGPLLAVLVGASACAWQPQLGRGRWRNAVLGLAVACAALLPLPAFTTNPRVTYRLTTVSPPLRSVFLSPTYSQPSALRELASWVEQHVPPDAIVRTDDPTVGSLLPALTGHRTDNGLLWEVAPTAAGRAAIDANRASGRGAFVSRSDLPPGVVAQERIGEWSVAWVP